MHERSRSCDNARRLALLVQRWDSICGFPALFIVGRDRGKLSYFWRHAYTLAVRGRYQGSVVNPDTGCPVYLGEEGQWRLSIDFKKAKLSEILGGSNGDESKKSRRALYSALWQADGKKIRRFAPMDFIGRYMPAVGIAQYATEIDSSQDVAA